MGLRIGGGIGPLRASIGTRSAGIGIGPISASTGYGRRGSGNTGCALILLFALVVAAVDWVAVHWVVTLPIGLGLTVLVIVLAVRTHRRRLAARAQAQSAVVAADEQLRTAIADLKPQLGSDYDDYVRAAHFVISTQTSGRDRLRAALNVTAVRATHLQMLLEQNGIISSPRGTHRDVLLGPDFASFFDPAAMVATRAATSPQPVAIAVPTSAQGSLTRFSGHLIWREMIASGRSPKDACCEVAGVPAPCPGAGRLG